MSQSETRTLLAEEIRTVGGTSRQPLIGAASAHLLATRGKRLRSALLLEAAALGAGADPVRARRAAAVVEVIHLASLAHDDVIDDSDLRRGTATVGARFGCRAAAFGGGWLFARCVEAMSACGDTAVRLLATSVAEMCDGQMLELEDIGAVDRTRDRYLRAAQGKTGALFALAARVGGELAGLPDSACAALSAFGTHLGIAFQIADDVQDLVADERATGKPRGGDLRHGVYTLPVIYALAERPVLRRRLTRPVRRDDLTEVVGLISGTRGIDRALDECRQHADIAARAVGDFAPDRDRHPFDALVRRALAPVWSTP